MSHLMRAAGILALAGAVVDTAAAQGKSGRRGNDAGAGVTVTANVVVFRDADRVAFRDYFVTRKIAATPLPPGIAKNVARGKPLPPGIARKALPDDLIAIAPRVERDVSFSIVGDVVVAVRAGIVIDVMVGIFK